MKIPFLETDGGRATSKYPNERTDCAVRAMALAFDVPYSEAHRYLTTHGRKQNCKFSMLRHLTAVAGKATVLGCKVSGRYYTGRSLTVEQHAKKHGKGLFLIIVRGHCTVVRDGCLEDSYYCARQFCKASFEIIKQRA